MVRTARSTTEVARAHGGLYPPWYDAWRLLDVDRSPLLSVGGRKVRPVEEPSEGLLALVRPDASEMDPLDAELAFELETRLPSFILPITDRTAMAHGVEARVPLLDHRVVELAAGIAPAVKMRGLREKAVLRGAVRDLLPRSILSRRKQPFLMPVQPWFFGPGAPAFVADELSPGRLRDAGLFDPEVVGGLRRRLHVSAPGHLDRLRLELILMLVLGSQLLQRLFVADLRPDRGRARLKRAATG